VDGEAGHAGVVSDLAGDGEWRGRDALTVVQIVQSDARPLRVGETADDLQRHAGGRLVRFQLELERVLRAKGYVAREDLADVLVAAALDVLLREDLGTVQHDAGVVDG